MTKSAVLAPKTVVTRFPAFFIALMIGNSAAIPTPPPTNKTCPKFFISVAFPKGPTKSFINSPVLIVAN